MTVTGLIVEQIVSRSVKKIALRTAQRKIGVNKAMSLVRRFDKRKTFVENLKKQPLKQLTKLAKTLAKRKMLSYLPPVKFIKNWMNYGMVECMKRCVLRYTPTTLKHPYYFIKNCKTQYEKVKLMSLGKDTFWKELSKLEQKERAKTLNDIIKFNPSIKELKEYWDFALDKEFTFILNSPMTQNFSQLPASYNITEKKLNIFIRGWAGTMGKTYEFKNIEWPIVMSAMKGVDFGKRIYSLLRTPIADYYARYWARKDPHYKR